MTYVYVRRLPGRTVLYSRRLVPYEKHNHDEFAALIAKQRDCEWQPNEYGNIIVNFQKQKRTGWCINNSHRYDFIRIKK